MMTLQLPLMTRCSGPLIAQLVGLGHALQHCSLSGELGLAAGLNDTACVSRCAARAGSRKRGFRRH
jgi:hypothetical protein